ncbi:response regulator [Paenibacillus caseinilyticus]|uniref:Circadian input-output histidine kinase CikA n=1 Tax=Paenibacillus mucilaginosus K02 TaxID=997761 RepID=I0BTS9_9BACL|nr:response regulator [Paenibacillus mucilaginosus]AFH65776.1 protein DhkJ [Paenibacillus mucilaginosus K02]AFK65409.1 hybrid signal transduction histidine kinase J [Paenibacillus mucilaginosus K02]
MKMRTKLFAGFGILLLLLFALAGIGISRLTNTDSSLSEIYENRYNKVKLATNMRSNASELAKGIANLLLISTPESDKKNLELIRTTSANVAKAMEDLEGLEYTPRGKELVSSLLTGGRRYLEYKDQVLGLYQNGKVAEANNLRTSSGVNIQDQFTASMAAFSGYQEEQMDAAIADAVDQNQQTMAATGILTLAALLLSVVIMYWIVTSMTKGLGTLTLMLQGFADGRWGDASYRVPITSNDEFGQLAAVFNRLADDLDATAAKEQELHRINEENLWLQSRVGEMYSAMQEMTKLGEMGELFIGQLARTVEAQSGAFYVLKDEGLHRRLELAGTYARSGGTAVPSFEIGEGLVGQCAKDGQPIFLEGGEEQGQVRLAFGEMKPLSVMVQPVIYDEEVIGVFELVSLKTYSELEMKFIDQASEVGGVALNSLQGRLKIEELLRIHQALTEELQTQSEELLSQQDELRASNERLEDQAKALRVSEELLQRQQEELEQSNEALLRKTAELEEQVRETEEVNRQVELARDSLEKQALELAVASRYKTEFLANMSHELRTPLNSLLILSQLLKENKDQNLSAKQVEYAETIHSSGSDLLRLIDDVLDLAKVESGRLDIQAETVRVQDVIDSLQRSFLPVARNRMLAFEIEVKEGTPVSLQSDSLRVQQILKNLLANAFKFTDSGCVKLTVEPAGGSEPMLAFTVEDTGIGIPPEKQQLVFEAFQQADGTTSRKYGGTGLGLSISRQLAALLGGTIELESEEGKGSRFTLSLPMVLQPVKAGREGVTAGGMHEARDAIAAAMASAGGSALAGALPGMPGARSPLSAPVLRPTGAAPAPVSDSFADDREHIEPGDKVLLIIEDDAQFATILLDMARSRGFKAVVALQGDSGLQLAKELRPDAILLDIQLPVLDGWAVMVQLKSDAATRHIPVHVISVNDEVLQGLSMGAIAWLRKPSTRDHLDQAFEQIQTFLERDIRSLLIVEPDEAQRIALIELIAHDDVSITAVESGREALEALRAASYDCMVIDFQLRDMAVYELLDEIKGDAELRRLPIMVYTGTELDKKEQLRLKKYAESIIIKDVRSPERLLDETSLFLHRVQEQLPEEKKTVLQKLHSIEAVFAGRKVLIVDDDIRNVFALSNLLEGLDMQVAFAETGKGALEQLEKEPDFDLVLMDIMMPEMDGYEAMRSIRDDERFDRLPIIALTAKAMKDDREKCIQAGASDYITKPVHTEQLLSLMRVWLSR